ncbi:MAG: divalent cation tolerance protein CutA [Deltaproteobacteria bacterium]|nr:divalent cation tolerance protein CutA [Deltaproteobacteria bacterium]
MNKEEGARPKFYADAMLGKLARWLRTLGYDAAYSRRISDRELVEEAVRQGRVILTRDTLLVKRRAAVGRSFFVESGDINEQLRQVDKRFELDASRALTRCLRCNTVLRKIERDLIRGGVPAYVYETQKEFSKCPSCGRIYWAGTHREGMIKTLSDIFSGRGGGMDKAAAGYVMVFVTTANAQDAERIGEKAVTERLAACCNIVPIMKSIYVWKGKLCKEPECLCIFKTRRSHFERLKKRIKELHGYEVPEVIAVPIEAGLEEYLEWIDESLAGR